MKTKTKFENRFWMQFKKLTAIEAGVLLAVLSVQTHAAPGDVDLSFDPGSALNGFVRAIAVQDDGKVLIGGDFTTTHNAVRQRIARFNEDGSLDDSFLAAIVSANPSGGWSPDVNCVTVQGDGKILVGGTFTSVNGMARTNLVRLNADGSLDDSFLSGLTVNGNVAAIVLIEEDQMLIQGSFTWVNGVARANLARLNADGSLDSSFAPAVAGSVKCLALQSDGKILIGGEFTSVGGVSRTNIARLNADGTLDRSFQEGMGGTDWWVSSIAVQDGGKVLIVGGFLSVNGVTRDRIARLNSNGTLDATFGASLAMGPGSEPVLALQADGRILVSGNIYQFNGVPQQYLGRFNADGSLDESFSAPLSSTWDWSVFCIVPRAAGEILIGGAFHYRTTTGIIHYFCQLDPTGALDSSFGLGNHTGLDGQLYCLAAQPDGAVVVGGDFTSVNGVSRNHLARLRPDGTLDSEFLNGLTGANARVEAITLQSDGKVLIGGWFGTVNGVARGDIARLHPDGTLDTGFLGADLQMPGGGTFVDAIAVQPDGKILIGGQFTTVNGVALGRIARLNTDGTLDGSFMNGLAGANRTVESLAVQSDGKILLGGTFSTINGVSRAGLARLNTNGSLDTSFTASVGASSDYYQVRTLVTQNDGRILIGGLFQSVNGTACTNLARLNANGTLDSSFLSGLARPDSAGVVSLAVEPTGRILIAGYFSKVNGVVRNHLARLNTDGTLDPTFVSSTGGADLNSGALEAVVVHGRGKIVIGGNFTMVNEMPRSFVARLMGDAPPLTILTPPKSQTVEIGSAAQFSTTATGYGPLTYQWFFNDIVPVSAATTNTSWELPDAQPAHAGRYAVVVTDAVGSVTSAPVMLNVIAPVERRSVPGINLFGEAGSLLNVDYVNTLSPAPDWVLLDTVSLISTSQYCFDLTATLPPQRFYRAWQTGTPAVPPSLNLNFVPAITLAGDIGNALRVDGINAIGPTDAWFTLDTVTLTNTTQLYFDVTAPGQPGRLYRLVTLY